MTRLLITKPRAIDQAAHPRQRIDAPSHWQPRDPLFATIFKAAAQVGIRHNPDYNGASQEGIAMSQATIAGGRRMSTARCYLDPVRNRRNLHIEIEALTEGLVLDGKRCTGTAVGRLLLTNCCSAMRDLPLSKRPERAILVSC